MDAMYDNTVVILVMILTSTTRISGTLVTDGSPFRMGAMTPVYDDNYISGCRSAPWPRTCEILPKLVMTSVR